MASGDAYIYAVIISKEHRICALKNYKKYVGALKLIAEELKDFEQITAANLPAFQKKMLKTQLSFSNAENGILDTCKENLGVIQVATDFQSEPYDSFYRLRYTPLKISDFIESFSGSLNKQTLTKLRKVHEDYMILCPVHQDERNDFMARINRPRSRE